MTMQAVTNSSIQIGGKTLSTSRTLSSDKVNILEKSIPAANAGDLTTRSDADTGVVTCDSAGHGITDSDLVDVYWTGGSRRSMTVTDVTGTAITVDGGDGDDFPSQDAEVTIAAQVEEVFATVGSTLKALGIACSAQSTIILAGADDAEDFARVFVQSTGGEYHWLESDGIANPIDGDTVTKVFLSHGGTAATLIQIGVLFD